MNSRQRHLTIALLIISAFICYTIIYISIRHTSTVQKMQFLHSLEGKTINRNELQKCIPKGLSELKKNKEIAFFKKFMNIINIPENAVLYNVNGKGIPNYYSIIIYDTSKNHIKKVYLRELK